jgi:hypothetical protein
MPYQVERVEVAYRLSNLRSSHISAFSYPECSVKHSTERRNQLIYLMSWRTDRSGLGLDAAFLNW